MRHGLRFVLAVALVLPLVGRAQDKKPAENWAERLQLSGDMRYRHELISEEKSKNLQVPDRNRHRLRVRLGMKGKINSHADAVVRLASGTGDPISTNTDLTGSFAAKPVWLDRAYLEYRHAKVLTGRAGKMGVPMESSEMLWDPDVNLEGMAALSSYKRDHGEFFLRTGAFWGAERKSADGPDQALFALQAGAAQKFDQGSAQLAVAYYDWGHVKHGPVFLDTKTGRGAGNSVDSAGGKWFYRNDYNLLDVVGSIQLKRGRVEGTFLGDFVKNTAADKKLAANNKENGTAWLAGVNLVFRKLPVNWELLYNYRDVQADAMIAAFADSEPTGGGTNLSGHRIGAAFSVLPSTKLGVNYYRDTKDPEGAKLKYNRLQVDVEAKF